MSKKTELERMQEDFQFTLSKISHEIRNPVTLIHSYLQLMVKKHPEAEQFEYWEDVQENMAYLIDLLDDLSVYNNAARLRTERLDIGSFLRSVTDSLRPSLEYLGISLEFQCADNLPPVKADATKLRQAILNIARNASEAVNENGRIGITAAQAGENIEITVTDNGAGIPAEYLPSLFEPFVTHKRDGTGLGLAISRQIAAAHGGDIRVHTALGQGSSFTLWLPIYSAGSPIT